MTDGAAHSSCAAGGWTLRVEVLLLSQRAGQVCYRRVSGTVSPTTTPHARALELAGLDEADPAALCHSTSWRVEEPGTVLLTYVALPDRSGASAVPLLREFIRAGDDGLWPGPDDLDIENIATHAVRHLAMLSDEDPTVRDRVPHARDLWRCIIHAGRAAETETETRLDSVG